ncbi:MAG: hypothetical protein BWX83_00586 [Candidatus Cloacimonetes bacterium ADurb.Bin117]|nr:MAG: hypothetical protein BWX83_00586 [Candidatus Cloacimonetes bacterium ADurb.Bin117]
MAVVGDGDATGGAAQNGGYAAGGTGAGVLEGDIEIAAFVVFRNVVVSVVIVRGGHFHPGSSSHGLGDGAHIGNAVVCAGCDGVVECTGRRVGKCDGGVARAVGESAAVDHIVVGDRHQGVVDPSGHTHGSGSGGDVGGMGHVHGDGGSCARGEAGVTKDVPGFEHIHAVGTIDIHHPAGTVVIQAADSCFGFGDQQVSHLILGAHRRAPGLVDGRGVHCHCTAIGIA